MSNLNRQFLFRKEHVGQSKAKIAAEAARAMRPCVKILHRHDSILSNEFDLAYYKQFAVVLNALDNLGIFAHLG